MEGVKREKNYLTLFLFPFFFLLFFFNITLGNLTFYNKTNPSSLSFALQTDPNKNFPPSFNSLNSPVLKEPKLPAPI